VVACALVTVVAVVAVGCDTASSRGVHDAEAERGPIGKADAERGSCEEDGTLLCGGPGTDTCWCDELCLDFEDCCSDAAPVCGIGEGDDGDDGGACDSAQQSPQSQQPSQCMPKCQVAEVWQIEQESVVEFDLEDNHWVNADVALANAGAQLALFIATSPNQDGPVVSSLRYAVAPVDGGAAGKFQTLSGGPQTTSHWHKAAASRPGEGLALAYNEWEREADGTLISRDLYVQRFGPDAEPKGDRISLGAANHPAIAANEDGYVVAYEVSGQVEVASITSDGVETSRLGPTKQGWKHPQVATDGDAVWISAAEEIDDLWGANFYKDQQPVELFEDAGFLPMESNGDLYSSLAAGGGSVAWAATPSGHSAGIAVAPGGHFTDLGAEYLGNADLVWVDDHFVALVGGHKSLRIYRVDVDGTVELQQQTNALGMVSDVDAVPVGNGVAFMTTDEADVSLARLVRVCPET